MPAGIITLSSDFGWPYPAAMRGVLAARCDARLIDISHEFPRGDLRTAAFWLGEICPYFPPAVHPVVIDPGVGTDRDVLVVRAGDHIFVGPDNGVLTHPAACISDCFDAFTLATYEAHSATFHGRDVFAPLVADVLIHGIDGVEALRPVDTIVELSLPEPDVSTGHARGEVLVVDEFGNVITNIPGSFVTTRIGKAVLVDEQLIPVEASYAHVGAGAPLVTIGSHGNVELAVNGGRGDRAFGLETGDPVTLRVHDEA